MAIVQDYYIGNTRILINDCVCKNKTPEERQQAKDNFARILYRELARKQREEKTAE